MMYEYLTGHLSHIFPTYLVLEVGGQGFKLLAANPFRWQDLLGQTVTIYVELVVREDAMTLYGFKNIEEKQLFLTLNRVSGIGPKSALAILALDDHQGLIGAIESGDAAYLTKFPGVGKKTAQQMVLDLKGTLDFIQAEVKVGESQAIDQPQSSQFIDEVLAALEGLGYSTRELKRITPDLEAAGLTSTQAGLSLAFKLLRK